MRTAQAGGGSSFADIVESTDPSCFRIETKAAGPAGAPAEKDEPLSLF